MEYVIIIASLLSGCLWRRLDGMNRNERAEYIKLNIPKGAWRATLAVTLCALCYLECGLWGLWIAGFTCLNMFLGFKFLTFGQGWSSWWMIGRYLLIGAIACIPVYQESIIYLIGCVIAGTCYPILTRIPNDKFPQWKIAHESTAYCELIAGALVIGGISILAVLG